MLFLFFYLFFAKSQSQQQQQDDDGEGETECGERLAVWQRNDLTFRYLNKITILIVFFITKVSLAENFH